MRPIITNEVGAQKRAHFMPIGEIKQQKLLKVIENFSRKVF